MTSEQKNAIESLRSQGLVYKEIAMETGLSEGTIKSYFHRSKRIESVPAVETSNIVVTEEPIMTVLYKPCHYCGKPVAQNPGRREKKFCSDSCRGHWWNKNKYSIQRKNTRVFICQSCGSEFSAYGEHDRKYCSHACYIEYDESAPTKNSAISSDLDLMLLEMDMDMEEDDNPFGEELEEDNDDSDEEDILTRDEYEFGDVDPEVFRDPTLLVKLLRRQTQEDRDSSKR